MPSSSHKALVPGAAAKPLGSPKGRRAVDQLMAEFEAESAYASALFCQMRGDAEGYVHMLQRSLEWLPTYAPAMQASGIAQYQLGQRAEGQRLLMGLLDLNEDTAHLFEIIDLAGDFLIEKRRYLEGLELYRGAAARFPSVPVFFQGLSCCADHLKRFDEAVAACRKALSLDPINAKLASDLGWCLFRAGRIAEALVELERAVEMDPADELARGNLTLVQKEITRGSRSRKKPRAATLAGDPVPEAEASAVPAGSPRLPGSSVEIPAPKGSSSWPAGSSDVRFPSQS